MNRTKRRAIIGLAMASRRICLSIYLKGLGHAVLGKFV